MSPSRRWLQATLLGLVILAASVKSYSTYASTIDVPDLMPQTVANGDAAAPSQYRVLVPLLWKAAVASGIAPPAAERGVIVLSILFCYAALAVVLYRTSRSVPVTAICLMAFYGAAASGFWFRHRDPFFDAAFTAIGMDLAIQDRPRWVPYAIFSAVASLNRETWLFSLIGAGVYRWFNAGTLRALFARHRRDVIGLAAAAAASIAVLACLRVAYGIRPYNNSLWSYATNIRLLLVAGSLRASLPQAIWFVGSGIFAVWVIFAVAGLARYVPFVIAFMGSLLAVSFLISNWWEARIFMSGYVVLLVSISGGLSVRVIPASVTISGSRTTASSG